MIDSNELCHTPLERRFTRARDPADLAYSAEGDLEMSPEEWKSFLDGFSLQHEGWLVSLCVVRGSTPEIVFNDNPLRGVALVCAGERCRVNISVLEGREERIYTIPELLRLIFKRDTTGAHQGLEIISAGGSVAALRFRAAALPESLDGILPGFEG
jgi:hypothetical protein